MERSVLLKHLPEMTGDAAFAKVIVLGQYDDKIYTLNVYADYETSRTDVEKISGHTEYAEFDSIYNENYRSIEITEASDILSDDVNTFLPESIKRNMLDIYAAQLEMEDLIQQEAEDFFNNK